MSNLIKKLFTKEDLATIATEIGKAEKTTAGEIRVSIRQRRRWSEKKKTLEAMARLEFQHLGMTKTKDRTGVLIFLLIEDKAFFILADEGIHAKVAEDTWAKIVGEMASHFAEKKFRYGVIHGVQSVGRVLSQYFPRKSNDTNELPNEVLVR